jgi:transcriptional regulator with XRE-family HTH domain
LGYRLRDLRLRAGLGLAEASEQAGISASYLSDVERGRTLPTLAVLLDIADGYGMLVQDLLDGLYPFATARRPRRPPAPPPDGRRRRA